MSTSSSQSRKPGVPSKGAASSPNKKPSSKHFKGGLVTIVVGSTKQAFTLHKELLVFYSDYFRAALNGSFKEATERKVKLLDVDEEVFEHFHSWLYTRNLAADDDEPLSWSDLCHLWIFGDRFQVPMLQNNVMDEIVAKEKREKTFTLALPIIAYRDTLEGSPLRKVAVEFLSYTTVVGYEDNSIMTADWRQYYTVEMLQDVIKEIDHARKIQTFYGKYPQRDKCFFHVHGKDEHC